MNVVLGSESQLAAGSEDPGDQVQEVAVPTTNGALSREVKPVLSVSPERVKGGGAAPQAIQVVFTGFANKDMHRLRAIPGPSAARAEAAALRVVRDAAHP